MDVMCSVVPAPCRIIDWRSLKTLGKSMKIELMVEVPGKK
jgi:hypothetical protein